jgi:hypothetical protein
MVRLRPHGTGLAKTAFAIIGKEDQLRAMSTKVDKMAEST